MIRTGISKESLLMDVMYSVNLINRWTSMQCVLLAIEEKEVSLLIPLVTAAIAAAVGTVGGFFCSI